MSRKYLLIFIFAIFLGNGACALSVRSMGMGGVYSPASRDPSGIFYNPAYLARSDSVRFSFDSMDSNVVPYNSLAVSVGDLAIAKASLGPDSTSYIGQGFNTYSFMRLGIGAKLQNDKRDFDLGVDADMGENVAISAASLNESGTIFEKRTVAAIAYRTPDQDRCLAFQTDFNGNSGIGFEQQFSPTDLYRFGYNNDHLTAGLTYRILWNTDLDLALDFAKDDTRAYFGVNLFRNTENKKINSNHSINFGKAIIGEDKFINIDGYNIHYVDSGKGVPLVLIGGGIHYTHHWDPYVEELSKRFRVINIDHVGAGESDKPNYFFGYTVEEQGEIIDELLNRLDIKEAYLLGYCYGGSVAFYMAGRYPERYKKLISIEGFVVGINSIPIAGENRRSARNVRHDLEYLNAYIMRDMVTFKYRLDYPYFNGKMWYQVNRDVLYSDLREEVRNLRAKVLYFAGTKSWAYEFLGPTKDYVRNNVKDIKYVEVEGAGHDVDRFDEAGFLKEAIDFLEAPK